MKNAASTAKIGVDPTDFRYFNPQADLDFVGALLKRKENQRPDISIVFESLIKLQIRSEDTFNTGHFKICTERTSRM